MHLQFAARMPFTGRMSFVRSLSFATMLGALLATASPALSAAPATDHLVAGAATPKDALLSAGDAGATYELRGGALVELSPGSTFALEPSIRVKLRKPGDPETVARSVRLVSGRAEVTIPAKYREQTAVLLRGSGKLSAVAKEGRVTFVEDGDHTTAGSRAGEMLVGLGNEWKPLKEGFARTLAAEDPTALARPILAAPDARTDHALIVVGASELGHVSATWTAVKDAVSYEAVIDAAHEKKYATTGGTTAAFGSLGPGSYDIRVVAIDKYGLASAPATGTVKILGFEAPEGASVATDGSVTLGRDQRVTLVGAKGLEVSYGTSPVFVTAPGTLGLAHNASTLVRLRAPGSTEEAVLRLEPKGLRANVAIGPRVARWPVDRVVVDVELYDANGHAVPDDAGVSAFVTVNLEKVDLKWSRHGHALHAELAPGTAPGPWVVRAEVHDAQGDLIGRNFLEVAPVRSANAGATASLAR